MDWTGFYAEIRNTIAVALPAYVAAGRTIHRVISLEKIDWEREVNPPRCIIQPGPAVQNPEFGLSNLVYDQPVTIHLLRADSGSTEETLDTELETLKDALYAKAFTTCQLVDVGERDVSESAPINQRMLQFNLQYTGGSLTSHFLIGDTQV